MYKRFPFLPGREKFVLELVVAVQWWQIPSLIHYLITPECVCGVATGHSLQPLLAPVDKKHLLNLPTCSLSVHQPSRSSSKLRKDHQTAELDSSLKPPNPLGSLKSREKISRGVCVYPLNSGYLWSFMQNDFQWEDKLCLCFWNTGKESYFTSVGSILLKKNMWL